MIIEALDLTYITWLFFMVEINKIPINILYFLFKGTRRDTDLLIFRSVSLVSFLFLTFDHRVCHSVFTEPNTRTNCKASYSFQLNQLGYSHIYWTLAKSPFLGINKKQSYNKGLFCFEKKPGFSNSLLLCNSCFTLAFNIV